MDSLVSGRQLAITGVVLSSILAAFLVSPASAWLSISLVLICSALIASARIAFYEMKYGAATGEKRARIWLVAGFATFFSLLLSVLMPPLQSPDEGAHLGRAYGLLEGEVLVVDFGERANQHVDDGLLKYISAWGERLPFKPEVQVTRDFDSKTRGVEWGGGVAEYYNPAAIYFPALYSPASLGMGVARALEQPPWIAVSWARLGMWLFASISLILALYIAQTGHRMMCAVAILPMSMAQAGSANLDSTTISLSLLLLGLFSWRTSKADRATKEIVARADVAIWVIIFLLAMAKPIFLVMLLPPLYWLIVGGKRWKLALPLAVLGSVLVWQAHVAISFSNPNPAIAGSPFGRLLEAITSPIDTLTLFARTILHKWEFYWRSMVGILGWLDTPLESGTYVGAAAVLVAALVGDMVEKNETSIWVKVLLFCTALAYCAGTLLLLWATWTDPASATIEGVQGRYFLPLLPAIGMSLSGMIGSSSQWRGRYDFAFLLMCVVYMIFITVDLPTNLILRYWL